MFDEADGVDNDVAVGVFVGEGHIGFSSQHEVGDRLEKAGFRWGFLVESKAIDFAPGLNGDWDVGSPIRVG